MPALSSVAFTKMQQSVGDWELQLWPRANLNECGRGSGHPQVDCAGRLPHDRQIYTLRDLVYFYSLLPWPAYWWAQ